MSNDIPEATRRAIDAAQTIEAKYLRQAQEELAVYFADNMQPATRTNNIKSKSGKLRALPNPSDKLYQLYGNLRRAFIPKQDGNIGKVVESPKGPAFVIGIDLEVVPYARIHEYGGTTGRKGRTTIKARPYLAPGIEAYMEADDEALQQAVIENAIRAWNE